MAEALYISVFPCVLACGHTMKFAPEPKIFDKVFCRRCDDYWPVMRIFPGEKRPNDRYHTVT